MNWEPTIVRQDRAQRFRISTLTGQAKLYDISAAAGGWVGVGGLDGISMVKWGGRCCTCSEWGRRARIAFLTSNRSVLGRSDGSAKLSLPRHRACTPAGISPATLTPPCVQLRVFATDTRRLLQLEGEITHF